ncbi:MAG: replication initiator protein [Microviridae sp.]|nr:MAG: replication initiator protein [Microviridae sp.]
MHEAQMHDANSFVTLTYRDEDCPVSLQYRHFQLFMKRLRRSNRNVRFYMCGEYGEEFGRPHYHAILFGKFFADREPLADYAAGQVLYRSAELEKLWPHGFSSIGDVTFDSAAYVARYVMKKVTGDRAEAHYLRETQSGQLVSVSPEFGQMSRRPGIGATWFEKFGSDVFSITRDGCRIGSVERKAPRFYDKCLAKVDPDRVEDLELRRYNKITPEVVAENEPERLAVRQVVAQARLAFKKRSLG